MSAVYRIEEKKCATCRWWNGERGVEFRANKPFYVKVGNSNSTCMAKSNGSASAATVCPKWTRWEKLWHHSPQLLATLVEEELRTGRFTYPQEAL